MKQRFFVIVCGPNPSWVEPAGNNTALERQHELAQASPKHYTVRVTERVVVKVDKDEREERR